VLLQISRRTTGEIVILLDLDSLERKARSDLECLMKRSRLKVDENTEEAEICRQE
jgi:hypothetical protein